jgi:hypothetical protein
MKCVAVPWYLGNAQLFLEDVQSVTWKAEVVQLSGADDEKLTLLKGAVIGGPEGSRSLSCCIVVSYSPVTCHRM